MIYRMFKETPTLATGQLFFFFVIPNQHQPPTIDQITVNYQHFFKKNKSNLSHQSPQATEDRRWVAVGGCACRLLPTDRPIDRPTDPNRAGILPELDCLCTWHVTTGQV
jgi:hypothetical protein